MKVSSFRNPGHTLTITTIPANKLLPTPNNSLTIEARIYPRAYKGPNDVPLLLLEQNSFFTYWNIAFQANQSATSPQIYGPQGADLLTRNEWEQFLDELNTWHEIRITVGPEILAGPNAGKTETMIYINGMLRKTTYPTKPQYGLSAPWQLTIGNFDGDVDEVRISRVVR